MGIKNIAFPFINVSGFSITELSLLHIMVSSLKNMMKHVLIPCGLATGVDGAPESLHKVRKRILHVNNKLPGVARVKTPRCIKGRRSWKGTDAVSFSLPHRWAKFC